MTADGGFRRAVAFAGAGKFGLALAHTTAKRGVPTWLFTTLEDRAARLARDRALPDVLPELTGFHPDIHITSNPDDIARHCGLVMLTVSTEYFLPMLKTLGNVLDGAHQVVHAVHLLEGATLERTTEAIQRHSCVKQVGVMAGPTHVHELLSGLPNALVVGSAFPSVLGAVRDALASEALPIWGSRDVRGVELAAALGQVVALARGIADGLQLGAAHHAALMTRGLHEIAALGVELGAQERTFSGLAGLGRILDAVQRGEANYLLGKALAQAADCQAVVRDAPPEALSIRVLQSLHDWAAWHGAELPLAEALHQVLLGQRPPAQAAGDLGWSEQGEE
jgi:glycerol-3-phosphate dehydrogenase (NAD(P)+)